LLINFIFDVVVKAKDATKIVNICVEKDSNRLSRDLLPFGSINSLTRLVFANSLYFNGVWEQQFDASKTKDYNFHPLNDISVEVPFMTSNKKQFIRAFKGFKVLGLPYKQGEDRREFSMYIFLPDAEDGLQALVEKIASQPELLECILPFQKVEVGDFRIPRFNISFGLETSRMLKELGVVLPFSPGGLTKMVESPASQDLYVHKIFHKSFMNVNEEEIKATAASAPNKRSLYSRPHQLDFVADHPFLFLIREDSTGTILFVGQVVNPLIG
jgi:serpin B